MRHATSALGGKVLYALLVVALPLLRLLIDGAVRAGAILAERCRRGPRGAAADLRPRTERQGSAQARTGA